LPLTHTPPIDLFIVGAQKAGTSSLKRYLGQHPAVQTHAHNEFTVFINDEEFAQGYAYGYEQMFEPTSPKHRVRVAKSAGILFEPVVLDRLKAHNPAMHLVVLLRHPIDRAYSAYGQARRRGWEDLPTFEEAIDAPPGRFGTHAVRRRNCLYVERSIYPQPIQDCQDRFGKDRVHVFLLEDMKQDPTGLCQTLFGKLDIDPSFKPQANDKHNAAVGARSAKMAQIISSQNPAKRMIKNLLPMGVGRSIKKRLQTLNQAPLDVPPMRPETRRRLIEHFKPHNAELAGLLNRDLSHWDA